MVVIAAELVLERGNLEEDKRQVAAYLERRKTTQPLEYPNSGCIFKNIDFSEVQIDADRVMKGLDVSQAEWNEATKFNKLPVSFILDHLGLKGKKIGGAQVSEKHAAFIVNIDHATAEEVIMLISAIKSEVRARLGIQLQEEVQYVGF